MRILFVIDSLDIGGAQRLVSDWVRCLSVEHEVGIYVLKGMHSYIEEQVLSMQGVTVIGHKSLFSPLHILRIAKLAKNYDVVHVNLFPAFYWAAIARLFLRNKKFVYTEHNTFNKRRNHPSLQQVEKWMYAQYDYVVAISDKVRESLAAWIGDSKQIVTINNGIDIEKFATAVAIKRDSIGISNDDVMIFMSARFSEAKDQATLVKSYPLLLNNSNVHIVFAGDGPLLTNVKSLSEKMDVTNNVHFLGNRNDIRELIKASDICVLSSKWEGFGLVAVEYMAAGKPVIASNVPGLNDIVRDAGLLFEQGNEQVLASQLNLLIADSSLRNQVAIKCQKRSKLYDMNKMLRSYLSLYMS